MSDFAVKVCEIATLSPIPDSERIELATLTTSAYRFVIRKDAYKIGQLVVYFPIDSVLPDNILAALDLTGKLSGPHANRVKTVKLRGQISQGIVSALDTPGLFPEDWHHELWAYAVGNDLTGILGVTKYEPPEDSVLRTPDANLLPLPDCAPFKYDIENWQNYQDVLTDLLDRQVDISEKVEGTHGGWFIDADADAGSMIGVLSRNYLIKPRIGTLSDFVLNTSGLPLPHRVLMDSGLWAKLDRVRCYLADLWGKPIKVLLCRGELLGPGIQGNLYELKIHEIRLFEIEADSVPIDSDLFWQISHLYNLPTVPPLALGVTLRDWLAANGGDLATASNGKSLINANKNREGLVIRPTHDYLLNHFGRVILKARSPQYQVKQD